MSMRQVSVPRDSGCTWCLVRHGETDWNRTGRIQGQNRHPVE